VSTEEQKKVVGRFYREAIDQGHFDLIDTLFAPDYSFSPSGSSERFNRDQLKQFLQTFRDALQFHHTLHNIVAEGDEVALRWTVHGTHQAKFFGRPPSSKPVTYQGMSIYRFADGKIVESWSNFDELGMLRQLGAIGVVPDA
jgi:steroid delta-isomerase-like uncharacterized protein